MSSVGRLVLANLLMARLCEVRSLRIEALGAERSMWDRLWMGLNGCFCRSAPELSQPQLMTAIRPSSFLVGVSFETVRQKVAGNIRARIIA